MRKLRDDLHGMGPACGAVGTSIRPFLNTNLDLSQMTVREIQAAGGGSLFRGVTAANPIGNAGRNILRANGINRLDFGLIKNARIREGHTFQIHANFFNATNTRDWGIPNGTYNAPAFLNEGAVEKDSSVGEVSASPGPSESGDLQSRVYLMPNAPP